MLSCVACAVADPLEAMFAESLRAESLRMESSGESRRLRHAQNRTQKHRKEAQIYAKCVEQYQERKRCPSIVCNALANNAHELMAANCNSRSCLT